MRWSHRVSAVLLRLNVNRLAIALCIIAVVLWLLVSAALVNAVPGLAARLLPSVQPVGVAELISPFLIVSLLSYGLIVAALFAQAIRLRQAGMLEWVDRTCQLRGDPNLDEDLERLRSFDPILREIIARTHGASARHRTLNAINQCISSYVDLDVILPEITSSAVELLHATSGCVALAGENGACHNVALYNFPDQMLRVEVPESVGIAGEVIERGQPAIVDDYSKYERRFKLWDSYGFRAIVGVPLVVEGRRIGALVVTTQDPVRRFVQTDVDLLSSFGNQAAIAIKNARLHSENLERIRELQRVEKELASRTAQLRNLLSKTFENEEEVRKRIAADIHDGIIQHVVGALFQLQSVKPLVGSGQSGARELAVKRLEAANDLLNQTVNEMYHVIHDLRPPCLDEMGLVHAVQSYLENMRVASGITCRLDVIGREREIDPDKQIAIYRILQEALNNVRKHSGVTAAELCIQFHGDRILVTIRDYGKGFDGQSRAHGASEHLGITDMEERAYSIGGCLQIRSAPGQGTTIMLEIPDTSPDKVTNELMVTGELGIDQLDPARRR